MGIKLNLDQILDWLKTTSNLEPNYAYCHAMLSPLHVMYILLTCTITSFFLLQLQEFILEKLIVYDHQVKVDQILDWLKSTSNLNPSYACHQDKQSSLRFIYALLNPNYACHQDKAFLRFSTWNLIFFLISSMHNAITLFFFIFFSKRYPLEKFFQADFHGPEKVLLGCQVGLQLVASLISLKPQPYPQTLLLYFSCSLDD